MKFSLYLKKFGKLKRLYKISRTSKGFYFISNNNEHTSYHEDGKYWIRSSVDNGSKIIKKIRQPLSLFRGAESLFQMNVMQYDMPNQEAKDETKVTVKSADIVIDAEIPFGLEFILTDKIIDLPKLPDRPLIKSYVVENVNPKIIIEVYKLINNTLSNFRFTKKHPIFYDKARI